VNVEIICPEGNMGDITGDISGKRGQITGTNSLSPGTVTISGLVPLSELNGYANRLKSVTGGQGSYSMELSHYEAVPPNVQAQLVNDYKASRKQAEED
jgi:elongation factor G